MGKHNFLEIGNIKYLVSKTNISVYVPSFIKSVPINRHREIMKIIIEEGVKIVFTSAGNPKTWTSFLKEKGITVVKCDRLKKTFITDSIFFVKVLIFFHR